MRLAPPRSTLSSQSRSRLVPQFGQAAHWSMPPLAAIQVFVETDSGLRTVEGALTMTQP